MRKKKGIRWTGTKVLVVLLAVALLVGGVVGGTLAWLISQSQEIENTFVVGNVGELKMMEKNKDAKDLTAAEKTFTIVPGVEIKKDPKVVYTPVSGDDIVPVDAFVFIEVDAEGWTQNGNAYSSTFLNWTVDSGWTYLQTTGSKAVFYRVVAKDASGPLTFPIITGDTITVNSNIKVENVKANTVNPGNLAFTAYAIQKDAMTGATEAEQATAAWTTLQSSTTP